MSPGTLLVNSQKRGGVSTGTLRVNCRRRKRREEMYRGTQGGTRRGTLRANSLRNKRTRLGRGELYIMVHYRQTVSDGGRELGGQAYVKVHLGLELRV